MAEKIKSGVAVQDTGHPVFDATVNILMNTHLNWKIDNIAEIHAAVKAMYEEEQQVDVSLKKVRRTAGSRAISVTQDEEIGAR